MYIYVYVLEYYNSIRDIVYDLYDSYLVVYSTMMFIWLHLLNNNHAPDWQPWMDISSMTR